MPKIKLEASVVNQPIQDAVMSSSKMEAVIDETHISNRKIIEVNENKILPKPVPLIQETLISLSDGILINQLTFPQLNKSFEFQMSDFEDGEYVGSSINLVKKFFHQPSQQSLAVKFIIIPGRRNKRDNERLAKAREKLIREIKLHKTLVDSQNIVTFYGACLYNEQALICMELMDMSLADFYQLVHEKQNFKQQKFGEDLLGCIGVSILDALFDCKSEEIIHRDVKPDNILMNYAGQIKLCDLGVSRILKNSFATTVVGTTHYWPPEHFTQQEAFDIRADIWSLGITLAEIARGKYPLVEDVSNYNLVTIGQVILEMNASTKAGLIEDIFKTYSQETKNFVHDCLKELNNRPKLDQLRNSGNDFGKFYVKYSQLKEPNYVAILIKEALEESETN